MMYKVKKSLYVFCALSLCFFASTHSSYADISPSVAQADEQLVVELPGNKANQFVKEARLRNLILIVAALILVFIAFAIFIVVYKRKSSEEDEEIKEYKEAYLVDLFNATEQQNFHITEKPVMLGRVAGRDPEFMQYIVLASSGIGRRHAVIEYKDYSFWLIDQGSINGSFVNDQPVRTEIRLKHGDRIRVYKDEFEFVIPGMEKEEATLIADKEGGSPAESALAATVVTNEVVAEAQNYDANDVMDLGFGTEMEADITEAPDVETPIEELVDLNPLSNHEDDFDMSLEQAPEPTTEMADILFADDVNEDDEATLLPEVVEDEEATLLPDMVQDNADVTITPGMDDDDDDLESDATLRPEK